MIILILAICPLLLCGCWDYTEVDNLAIVSGIAVDKDGLSNTYIVTTEIITTRMQGAASVISSELYMSEGESVFAAVRNMIENTGLELFWSDAKVMIISEAIAMEGIIPVVDWLNRSTDVRPNLWFLVSKDETAAEILKTKVKLNEVVSFHLDETMHSGVVLSKYTYSSLWSFVDRMTSESNSQTIASVKNELNDNNVAPRVTGSAVFKRDKLVGYLDGTETLYMLMLRNNIKSGLITFKNVAVSDTNVTLELYENKTKLTPLYRTGSPILIIDIFPIISIAEIQGTKNFIEEESLKALKNEAENNMEANMLSLISKLQKSNSDILDFVESFHKEKPKETEKLKNSGVSLFSEMEIEVNVHMQIMSSGRTNSSITIEK